MIEAYPLALSLFDFLPNLAFLVGAYYLVHLALLVRGRSCALLLTGGTLFVFLGGFLKALWKLLYTTGAADVTLLSEAQFVLLAPGFVAMLMAMILIARRKPGPGSATTLMAMAPWKIPFLAVMTVCSLAAEGILAYVAFRQGARAAGVLFSVAMLALLGMAGLAGGEQTVARQWVEEGVNTAGQTAFAVASFLLHRAYVAARARGEALCD